MLRDHNAVFDGEAEFARDIAEKILAIVIGLEAEQIVGQHRRDQLAMIGHALHHRGDRPRRMKEEADRLTNAETAQLAYERAFACDPQSAYGGVIAVNRRVDRAFAAELSKQFIEVLLAPGFEPDALELLGEKKNVRLLELAHWPAQTDRRSASEVEGKPVIGGQLLQTRDVVSETREQMSVMTDGEPSEQEWDDLLFAWKVCRHVRRSASAPGR